MSCAAGWRGGEGRGGEEDDPQVIQSLSSLLNPRRPEKKERPWKLKAAAAG